MGDTRREIKAILEMFSWADETDDPRAGVAFTGFVTGVVLALDNENDARNMMAALIRHGMPVPSKEAVSWIVSLIRSLPDPD